jgi:hypothetical protein
MLLKISGGIDEAKSACAEAQDFDKSLLLPI